MGQVESQPLFNGLNSPPETVPKKDPSNGKGRKHAGSTTGDIDASSQASAKSSFASRASRSPLSWAAAGVDLVASTTADVALSTMSAAFKTASVLASTTEAAANVVASTTTNVAINTASVATQTASLITTATSAGAKSAGDAIAGTASLVVEGFAQSGQTSSPKHVLTRDDRTRSRSGDSSGALSPQSRAVFFATTGGRGVTEMMLPEAMGLGTLKSSNSHDNLSEVDQKISRRRVGSRFWCMVGATNISARKHWVATVTSSKPSAPSAKYLRKILALAWETKGQSVEEFYRLLQMRPITTSPNCALKALITSLRIVREGPPEALALSISHVGLIDGVGATWAERVLLDVAPEEPLSAGALGHSQTVGSSNSGSRSTSPYGQVMLSSSAMMAPTSVVHNDLLDQMLIARLSGLIVQKMHFHSMRTSLNSRYEETGSAPTPNSDNGDSDNPIKSAALPQTGGDEWECQVQLVSSLLTLLGTIEGVARLALGMGGQSSVNPDPPSTAALSLAAVLIEEALSAFDALSAALLRTLNNKERDQDTTVVRSLLARYHEAYDSMRAYCMVALKYPYVVALNKVPHLDDELSPLSRGVSPLTRLASASSTASAPSISPMNTMFSTNASGGTPLSPTSSVSSSGGGKTGGKRGAPLTTAPSLAARPFTRRSILETLEEEEALEDLLGAKSTTRSQDGTRISNSNALKSPLLSKKDSVEVGEVNGLDRSRSTSHGGEDEEETGEMLMMDTNRQHHMMMFNPWEYSSNSVEHARPPSQFCLEEEEEDSEELQFGNPTVHTDDEEKDDESNGTSLPMFQGQSDAQETGSGLLLSLIHI